PRALVRVYGRRAAGVSAHPSFETVLALWAGDLDASQAAAVDEHLFACDACAAVTQRLASVVSALRAKLPFVISHAHRDRPPPAHGPHPPAAGAGRPGRRPPPARRPGVAASPRRSRPPRPRRRGDGAPGGDPVLAGGCPLRGGEGGGPRRARPPLRT